ncbi:MAG: ABC transporter substrate-binding protein [Deltaproteobacteria bacterium]|nr:ABC transporter substrate-binding protein [Deltaproteobacteria bacterium]
MTQHLPEHAVPAQRHPGLDPGSILFPIILFLCLIVSPKPAYSFERIISLKPNITEILFALGVGDQVVGVTQFCDYPAQVKSLPKVADYINVNVEKVLTLHPDLILTSEENSSKKDILFLMQQGLRVEQLNFQTLNDIRASFLKLGMLLGKAEVGGKIVNEMEQRLHQLKDKAGRVKPLKAMLVVGHRPLVVVGSGNFFNEACDYVGLINVFGNSKLPYPRVDSELILLKAPEIIFYLYMGSEDSLDPDFGPGLQNVPAIKNKRVYKVPISLLRASSRVVQGYEYLWNLAHGDHSLQ